MLARLKISPSSIWPGCTGAIALAHVGVLFFSRKQIQASNLIQVIAALFVVATCLLQSKHTADPYLRSAWLQLSAAFAVYSAAQTYFAYAIIWKTTALSFHLFPIASG